MLALTSLTATAAAQTEADSAILAREAERRKLDQRPAIRRTIAESIAQTLVHREVDQRIADTSVTDTDIAAYYQAQQAEFQKPEERRALHLLVSSRERAQELLIEARAGDVRTFKTLAEKNSLDDETKLRGGELGYFTLKPASDRKDPAVDPTLVTAAFNLGELDDVSAPVQLATGWSLVKLVGIRPAVS
jgi:parvulin-like peptidyl-prolyl isomerase